MNAKLYALKQDWNHLYAWTPSSLEAAVRLAQGQEVILATIDELEQLARRRKKLLYIPAIHAEDAPTGVLANVA